MTTISQQAYVTPYAMPGVTRGGLASRLQECVRFVARALDRQRQRRALLDLDDHMLNDIGKSRQEALIEAGKPFWK
jgi:uncharacterized protein YjiS (DUF1127 family)